MCLKNIEIDWIGITIPIHYPRKQILSGNVQQTKKEDSKNCCLRIIKKKWKASASPLIKAGISLLASSRDHTLRQCDEDWSTGAPAEDRTAGAAGGKTATARNKSLEANTARFTSTI